MHYSGEGVKVLLASVSAHRNLVYELDEYQCYSLNAYIKKILYSSNKDSDFLIPFTGPELEDVVFFDDERQ